MAEPKWERRTERCLSVRSGQGRPIKVVREMYLRPDVPCFSPLCIAGCNSDSDALLPETCNHYVVPDCHITRDYLELFELSDMQGVVFTQTAAHCVQHEGSRRLAARLRRLVQSPGAGCVMLCNEFQTYAHCPQHDQETTADWQTRSTFKAAEWLYDHLAGQIPIIMVTETEQAAEVYQNERMGVLVMSFQQYIREFWQGQTAVLELYASLSEAATTRKHASKQSSGYLPLAVLEEGLKMGRFVSGRLNVNRFNASSEAFVTRSGCDVTEDSGSDILIVGSGDRNRAVHGDQVVVDILPRSQWRTRSMAVHIVTDDIHIEDDMEDQTTEQEVTEAGGNEKDDSVKASEIEGSEKEGSERRLPTGRVVGILRRQWRDYVASVSPDEEVNKHNNKSGKILVVPWDYRIPKIRIATRQVDIIKEQRCLVRIDTWPADSQYPNGHLVKVLGPIGDLETEIAALLAENELTTSAFTPAQLAELPADSEDQPWQMTEDEVERRRDIRKSHLVFSIDPQGCEDVDDTLSLRKLDNGNLELGVHIADVTYFVRAGSLTDQEAQGRSTTVYLADRRYDMLPPVLSANLCSLLSGQDRYAVSVMWELTPKFEVVSVWYGRTIIHSQYKLFYEMAQKVCDGCTNQDIVDNVPELQSVSPDQLTHRLRELRWALLKLTEIGRSLKARRTHCGALELESVEVQVQLTETKGVEDLTPKEHLEVHETIAECMIFANHWVAKKIAEAFPSRALLRSHPPPRQDQFDNLLKCAATRGFHIDTSSNKALAASLQACTDAKDSLLNTLLKSLATLAMSNARYLCTGVVHRDELSHYGLALDLYTHFTSPIRRYADVIVHRLLLAAVEEEENTGDVTSTLLPGVRQLEDMTNHMNNKHRAAQNAQRDSQELFQSIFFRDREDDDDVCTADAVVYQLRSNGVFVFVPRYGVKGVAYLQDRSGQVVYIPSGAAPEWVSGSLTRSDRAVAVECAHGVQTYSLLEHITVRLSVNTSRAHCQSLKISIVAKQPHDISGGQSAEVTTKADIVQSVKKGAEEQEKADCGTLLDSLSPDLSCFRQTDPQHSLYHLFQSFHHAGLHV